MPTMRLTGVQIVMLSGVLAAAPSFAGAQVFAPSATPSGAPNVVMTAPQPAPYAAFTKNMKREEGLFTVLSRDSEIFLELNRSQFDRTYILATTIATGIGGYGLAPGQYAGEHLITFRRAGSRLLLIEKNPHFSARANTPEESSMNASVSDSVWMALPIAAEDAKRGVVVISAAPFLNDVDGITQFLNFPRLTSGGPVFGTYHVDPSRSYFEWAKAFPKNVNLLAALTLAGKGFAGGSAADAQSLFMRLHYSFAELPASDGYVPRLADDRVGYFESAHEDFSAEDSTGDPMVRYIDRWNLRNGPIRFYLTNEIPLEYRTTVRSALLRWDDAFAKIGHPHAVEVLDQPKDPQWDPEDIRYSTVRWVSNHAPGFSAEGQILVHPLTGEILRASIIVDGEAIRAMQRGQIESLSLEQASGPESLERSIEANAAYALTALQLQSNLSEANRRRYARDLLYAIVLHEAGHAFGLRHNFAASTAYTPRQLRDPRFTARYGIASSVMDYLPVNLWSRDSARGELIQRRPGVYDDWAIKYGYASFPTTTAGAELPYLRSIATQSTLPGHAYGTDEDATAYGGYDPHIQQMDLSSDPLAFDDVQMVIARRSMGVLDVRYPKDDKSYAAERRAFDALFAQYEQSAVLGARYIGGYYTSRSHRGQRNGTQPFRPLPRAEEKRAFDVLARNVFGENALHLSPHLLNDLGALRHDDWGNPRLEPPEEDAITDRVDELQTAVLRTLFSVPAMNRILESQARTSGTAQTMSLDDLFNWTTASVWDSLEDRSAATIDAFHRSLQRTYTDLLTEMIVLDGPPKRNFFGYTFKLPPVQAQERARYELVQIQARIRARLASGRRFDVESRAHLQDMANRIDASLRAQEQRF